MHITLFLQTETKALGMRKKIDDESLEFVVEQLKENDMLSSKQMIARTSFLSSSSLESRLYQKQLMVE